MSPEELQFTVQQHRQRAYTDMTFEHSSGFKSLDFGSFTSTDLGSPVSTEMGSSSPVSTGSTAGDVSDRWADMCDSDDDLPSPPPRSPQSRPEGTWFSPQSPPSSLAGTWFLPPTCVSLETQMAAATEKAKERAAVEAKSAGSKGKAQKTEKKTQKKEICDASLRTTLVLRKLQKDVTRISVLEMLDTAGLKGLYNFVYLPMDFKKGKVFGHTIVNFISNEAAEQASSHFAGAGVNIEWSDSHQGFDSLIERYRDSPIMHESMPETSKPIIFCNGVEVPFPSPTKEIEPLSKN